jgi:hypothetical protein
MDLSLWKFRRSTRFQTSLTLFLVSITFLLLSFQVTQAQVIKGRLLDVETDSAVSFASVYFNAAYKGTSSDSEGYFQLPVSEYQGQTIVFSSVGYESAFLETYERGAFYEIYMKPRRTLLEDVVVEPDEMPRELKERIFKNQFLGRSDNALSCQVENMQDIRLVYFKSSKTLEGYCDEPIIIWNKALGYKINYYLEKFESRPESIVYQGNFFFENDASVSKRKFKRIEKRRRSVYRGSRMHFFRALWGDQLKKEKWRILSSKKTRLEYQDIVVEKASQKFFRSSVPLTIRYRKNSPTFLEFKKPEIFFSQKGHFDPSGLNWSGEMSNERVGDLLPFGYLPKSKFNKRK